MTKSQTTINLAVINIVRQWIPIYHKLATRKSVFDQLRVPYLFVSFVPHFSLLSTTSFVNPFTPIDKLDQAKQRKK